MGKKEGDVLVGYVAELRRAEKLPSSELMRHAVVAEAEGDYRCKSCFCCAAEEVLLARMFMDSLLTRVAQAAGRGKYVN